MSDRIPGTSWSNPIWHGRWRIYASTICGRATYEFVHDDYDGAPDSNDNRCGYAATVDEAKAEIDAWEADNESDPDRLREDRDDRARLLKEEGGSPE